MVDVELTGKDYKVILSWYELAFGKSKKQNEKDATVFRKISVMCMAKIEEEREKNEN